MDFGFKGEGLWAIQYKWHIESDQKNQFIPVTAPDTPVFKRDFGFARDKSY